MRNPWGSESYTGPWKDGDSEWNSVSQAEKDRVGYKVDTNDGIFFMPMNVYVSDFEYLNHVPDLDEANAVRFLMLDDTTEYDAAKGHVFVAGSAKHNFTLTSAVAQTVYLDLFVHNTRSYPTNVACETDGFFVLHAEGYQGRGIGNGHASQKVELSAG
jgi:hypothetical protein